MVADLNLPVAVYEARGEDILDDFRFTTLVNRAVGSIRKLCTWIEPHWGSIDRMLTIKGPNGLMNAAKPGIYGILNDLELRVVRFISARRG